MKKLYIIRHANANSHTINCDDYDRVLSQKGEEEATFIGKLLFNKNAIPDLILSSPAKRTMSTAEIISKEIGYQKQIVPNQYIYEAYVTSLKEIVEYIDDEYETVFLVGHNPGVSLLAYMLCGIKETFVTCGVVEIQFNCDSWMEVSKDNASFISYEYPKI